MPKVETIITRFDGGISEDKRAGWAGSGNRFTTNKFSLTKHFDVFTYPKKLVPYKKTEADETKSYDIVKFLFAPHFVQTYGLYGFGVSTTTKGAPYIHNASLVATGWTAPTGGGSAVSGRDEDVFFYYKDYIYWWAGGTSLMRYDTGVSDDFASYQSIVHSYVAQPVHHPADDIAYFFYNNKVASLNDTSWTLAALTLPDDLKIVAAVPYGNYLAIACVSIQTRDRKNIVYLWDRDSSLATLTERIDFGDGEILHLANLNNKLIAVMSFYLYDVANISLDRGKILIKQASGNYAITLNEINTDDDVLVDDLPKTRFATGDKLYFPAKLILNGDNREGIWVVDEFGRVTLDFIEEEAADYQGIYKTGNMWWIAHSDDGSVNKTDFDDATYSHTSIYETLVFTAGDSSITKKLVGAEVMFEKLPSAGVVVLKYRIDGATSWTQIFSHGIDDSISHEAINIESSGANLKEYKEVEFRIESTGGAVITGLRFVSDITEKGRLF